MKFKITNKAGQYLGTYRALTARAAIAAMMHDQAVYLGQFRRGVVLKADELTATPVEGGGE